MAEAGATEDGAQGRWLFASLALLVLVAAAGGGSASREAPLRLMAVELAAAPPLVLALIAFARARRLGSAPILFGLAMVLAPLIQLVPLPPAFWSRLPGRAVVAQALDVFELGRPWLPASLAPFETWRSLLALAPPIAMTWGAAALTPDGRRRLAFLWLGLGLVGLGFGAVQRLAPGSSAVWLYAPINPGSPVGLFANRNHEAAFLVALIPLCGAALAEAIRARRWSLGAVVALIALTLAVVGLAAIRSRAGVVLGAPALLAALALVWRARGGGGRGLAAGLIGLMTAAAALVAVTGGGPVAERFAGGGPEYRGLAWPVVERAAAAYAPLGAGPGSYETVFRAVEPLSLLSAFTSNHADNDYLELWLECGVVGAALVLIFLLWCAPRAVRAWTRAAGDGDMARAAAVSIALLLAHSAVDEPLRTSALSTLFGLLCAMLWAPSFSVSRSRSA